ncbi:unnamed protein product [Protopolystoma xenopodis]|uniref:Uncharacterized protein n=1 Tax=Protopolystoma xenopodis TaxID=117903 RepID=A0A3S5ABY2_9PLAT|nr:unnamed protein product [Protopolystoma xenopodis]
MQLMESSISRARFHEQLLAAAFDASQAAVAAGSTSSARASLGTFDTVGESRSTKVKIARQAASRSVSGGSENSSARASGSEGGRRGAVTTGSVRGVFTGNGGGIGCVGPTPQVVSRFFRRGLPSTSSLGCGSLFSAENKARALASIGGGESTTGTTTPAVSSGAYTQ